MIYPTLYEMETSRQTVDIFKGYNRNLRIGEGEFYDMKNLTSSYYPVLSPRSRRGTYLSDLKNPFGLISKDSLGYIADGEFHLNQYSTTGLNLDPYNKAVIEKTTMVSMGAYVIIITRDAKGDIIDKKWVNTNGALTEHGDIEAKKITSTAVKYSLCTVDGADYTTVPGPSAPTITEEMEAGTAEVPFWVDTSSTPNSLKQYSLTTDAWVTVPTTYIKISATGIGEAFEVNDGVTISGVEPDSLQDLNSTMAIWAKGDNYIVVLGILDVERTQDAPIIVKRTMPDVDFLIESENRLWGCKYGISDGKVVNEIYASKLGDFKNWNCFMGISTDSYAASVGTDGKFTGAITHLGYPLFFKENFMHKVYGNYPANFQIQTTACRGVQDGCDRSLAIVNETLYYKSRSAVCAYDGALPSEISYALGEIAYSNAVGASHGNKYYISMKDTADVYNLFVYDAAKGLWHKEDDLRAEAFCSCRGELYFIENGKADIKTMFGSGKADTKPVKWEAETGIIGTDSPDKKYISKLNVRMSLDIGSTVYFYIQYDSCGEWEFLFNMTGTALKSFTIPIRIRRSDHLRLKIVGEGEAKIYSIVKTIEQGSDI